MQLFVPATLALILLGVIVGLIFGALPGLSATMAIALLLPVTFAMPPDVGIAMLIATYTGGVPGGLVAATLLRIPGTPSSIAMTFDGYPLARKGQVIKALATGMVASAVGSILGLMVLVAFAPVIARFAINFGAAEYTSLTIAALTLVIVLSPSTSASVCCRASAARLRTSWPMAPRAWRRSSPRHSARAMSRASMPPKPPTIPRSGVPFPRILLVPRHYLVPILALLMVVGVYLREFRSFDLWVILAMGLLGYLLERHGFPMGPLVLGFVLGTIFETNLRRALMYAHGDWSTFVTRPVSGVLLPGAGLLLAYSIWKIIAGRRRKPRRA